MEYYGIRKSGADIDLVITGEDYEQYRSPMYHAEALTHVRTYEKNHGVVFKT